LPDVSFRKVKLVTQSGNTESAADVVLMFLDDRLAVSPSAGGSLLRTLRYLDITSAAYAKGEKKRLGFIKSSQHLLTVETAGEPLLLRLDGENFTAVLNALEARTGKPVSR
jgi:hypothetical protein